MAKRPVKPARTKAKPARKPAKTVRPKAKAKAKAAPAKAAPAKAKAASAPARTAPDKARKRPARPAGMPWLSPYLTVKDADAALDFYHKAFGFEKKNAMPGSDGQTVHAEMTYKDAVIMFGAEAFSGHSRAPASTGNSSPVSIYVYCDDVDALFARATAAGASVGFTPKDMFYGDRVCSLSDPDGHLWSFATNVADFDPSKVPH